MIAWGTWFGLQGQPAMRPFLPTATVRGMMSLTGILADGKHGCKACAAEGTVQAGRGRTAGGALLDMYANHNACRAGLMLDTGPA